MTRTVKLLHERMLKYNWVGYYMLEKKSSEPPMLVLGAFEGAMTPHTRIPLNQGIDFRGGTSWEVKAPHVSVARARDALRPVGLAEARIQILGSDTLRVQSRIDVRELEPVRS